MHLSTDLLRTFVAVVETSSFTKAGAVISRTQSAVSQQIHRLEDELGQSLFLRNGRDITPTPQGHALLPHARRMLRVHDEAVNALSRPEVSGLVRLGAPDIYAAGYLPDVLSRFSATHPLVRVDLRCEPSPQLEEDFARGELDLVVGSYGSLPDNAELVGRENLRWVTSATRPVHGENPLPLAVYETYCCYRRWATTALDRTGIPYRIAYVSQSLAGIQAAVRAGLAVSALDESAIPPGTRILGPRDGFPDLPQANLALLKPETPSELVQRLAEAVTEGLAVSLGRTGRMAAH